jgi:hypothetical protein
LIKPLLGDRFYFDLINNLDNEKYQPLLDGCAFTYFGISYAHDGIKALLLIILWQSMSCK